MVKTTMDCLLLFLVGSFDRCSSTSRRVAQRFDDWCYGEVAKRYVTACQSSKELFVMDELYEYEVGIVDARSGSDSGKLLYLVEKPL